jgi:hypothetical protein
VKVIKKLVVPTGEYTDKNTGETKTSWLKIGVLQSDGNDKYKVKLDSIPVGDFNGWVECFDIEPRQGGQGGGSGKMGDWD